MDLTDVELRENLPVGIIIDSSTKLLDKFGFNFAMSGIDFETCVTMACLKEVIRLSPVKVIIAERTFFGGSISDIVELSRSSPTKFKVLLWTDNRNGLTSGILKQAGISGLILKNQPFEKILKRIRKFF